MTYAWQSWVDNLLLSLPISEFLNSIYQGKAVNRAERKCREELCGNFEDNLKKDICIRKCISKDCHKEMYAWNEVC